MILEGYWKKRLGRRHKELFIFLTCQVFFLGYENKKLGFTWHALIIDVGQPQ
jgi:hypothetical protein